MEVLITVSAPGKTILHGEHSVVYGKAAIAVAVNLRTKVILSTANGGKNVTLRLDNVGLQSKFYKEWLADDITKLSSTAVEEDGIIPVTEDYLQRIRKFTDITEVESSASHQSALTFLYLYASITRKYCDKKLSPAASVRVTSELPVGAGLGSSASYSVCLSAALLQLCGKIKNEQPLTDSSLELINKWAYQAERILHGRPSGIDNSICTYGGALLFQNGAIQKTLRKLPQLKILLVNTKVPRNTKNLVSKVKSRYDNYPTVMAPILEAMEEIALTQWDVLTALSTNSWSNENPDSLHDLVIMNQHLLNCLGAGHPKLDAICGLADAFGLAAKLTGAGGGGCAIVFLKDSGDSVVSQIKDRCLADGFNVWEVELACAGVTLH